jgi:hypothetical protein
VIETSGKKVFVCPTSLTFIRNRHQQLSSMSVLSNMDLQLLSMWNDGELSQSLRHVIDCQHSLGREMTNEERNRFEKITAIFPAAPPPSPARATPREHFTRKEVWDAVWPFLQQYPILMGATIEEILQKLEHLQRSG